MFDEEHNMSWNSVSVGLAGQANSSVKVPVTVRARKRERQAKG